KQTNKAVEIIDVVQLEDIDPIYFEKSYYLSPDDGGSKAYSLIRTALEDTGKIGVAKMMIRSKEQLAVIRIYENTLVVETIHYPDEVRATADVPNVPEAETTEKKELDTAKMLIDQLTTEFDPEKYTDEYRTALMELIEEKKNQDETTTAPEKAKPDNVTNLMDALQASLDKAKKDKPAAKTKKKTSSQTGMKKTTSQTGSKKTSTKKKVAK